MVAGFGTLVEAVSWRGFDNLFLPLGILVFLASHGGREVWDLLALAGLFAATMIGFRAVAPLVGLNNHAARVYVTTVFLLLAVTDLHNAALPISVLLAQAWARAVFPGDSKYPDLDIVAGVVVISLFWLTLGNATGWNAVSFYGIAAMGMSFGFCCLALVRKPMFTRLVGLAAVLAALVAMRAWGFAMNDEVRNWNGPMWGIIALQISLIGLTTWTFPVLFQRYRVTVMTAIATLPPFVLYVVKTNAGGIVP